MTKLVAKPRRTRQVAYAVFLCTNRNCIVYDRDKQQIPAYQRGIMCSKLSPSIVRRVAREAKVFYLAKYGEWTHTITKIEFLYLLGEHEEADKYRDSLRKVWD